MSDKNSLEELALAVDEAQWQWLKPHLERGAIITVSAALDLAEAGERIAADDMTLVSQWIESGKVGKPTLDQITAWDAEPAKKFLMLVISPYVLIQEIGYRAVMKLPKAKALGEAGVKVVAEWFPERERALAAGLFNSGSAVGAILAPPLTAWILLRYGWQAAFGVVGVPGLVLALAGSLLAAFAPNLMVLTLARTLQGAGSAAGMVVGRALVQDHFHGHGRTRMMAYIGMTLGLCPPLASLLGGQADKSAA